MTNLFQPSERQQRFLNYVASGSFVFLQGKLNAEQSAAANVLVAEGLLTWRTGLSQGWAGLDVTELGLAYVTEG